MEKQQDSLLMERFNGLSLGVMDFFRQLKQMVKGLHSQHLRP